MTNVPDHVGFAPRQSIDRIGDLSTDNRRFCLQMSTKPNGLTVRLMSNSVRHWHTLPVILEKITLFYRVTYLLSSITLWTRRSHRSRLTRGSIRSRASVSSGFTFLPFIFNTNTGWFTFFALDSRYSRCTTRSRASWGSRLSGLALNEYNIVSRVYHYFPSGIDTALTSVPLHPS